MNSPYGFAIGSTLPLSRKGFFLPKIMRTYIYIDGFNLYYGAVKSTPFRWLDLMSLSRILLQPHHQIRRIKYFTARVSGTSTDRSKPDRQDAYLRALKAHIPEIEIYYGHFLQNLKTVWLSPPIAGHQSATAIRTEEKGSDVNLAVHLLNDAWKNEYDCAVLVSNDSDLAEALRIVKSELKKMIGLVTPTRFRVSSELRQYATFAKQIRQTALAASQLPDPIPNTKIYKPPAW